MIWLGVILPATGSNSLPARTAVTRADWDVTKLALVTIAMKQVNSCFRVIGSSDYVA
jgi:hypothetical protein